MANSLLIRSFERHLRAENKSQNTVYLYVSAATALEQWAGVPVEAVTLAQVDAYLLAVMERSSPGNAANKFRSLQQFYRWAVAEGELAVSPMERMRPPHPPERSIPILSDDALRALLGTVEGKRDFESRRDLAILRVLIDTGARRGALAGLRYVPDDPTVNDVDLDQGLLRVRTKGDRELVIPVGSKTTVALDRYLRVRRTHPYAYLRELWVGRRGKFGPWGIRQMLLRRGQEAGIGHVHPHQFRHTAAHRWLMAGGQEADLMRLMGWKSRSMTQRYGSSAADERAREAFKRLSLGDQL